MINLVLVLSWLSGALTIYALMGERIQVKRDKAGRFTAQ